MTNMKSLRELVQLQRGQSYKSALLGLAGPSLLGLGTINRNGGFRGENLKSYGGASPEKILLRPGDLYVSLKDVSHAADLLGSVARVPESVTLGRLTQDTIRLDVNADAVDRNYLYWALRDPAFRAYCRAHGTGTTNLDLSQRDFLAYEVTVPTRAEQRAIANMLDVLEDKIFSNKKLANTADRLATSLFHDRVKLATYSEETFSDIARISGGGTPSTKEPDYWDGNVSWATPTDVTGLVGPYLETTSRTISHDGLAKCSSELYPRGTILMTSRATIGAFALVQEPTAVNQGFITVQPHDPGLTYWIFHEMRSRTPEFTSLANGATFLELSRGNFKKFKVRLAELPVMHSFNETARALHDAARNALLENLILIETRDVFLPHLMSGNVRVKDAAKILEAAL